MFDDGLLREPVDRGIRLVALSLVADAQAASDTLKGASRELRRGSAKSDDALHDFRVAVRRLRSWIRAFKPFLRDAVSRRQRRRLSKIARATSRTRDATVHLEWLQTERRRLSPRQRAGHGWLKTRLETQRSDGAEAAVAAASDFDAMVGKLTRRLNRYCSTVVVDDAQGLFGAAVGDRILLQSNSLQRCLAAIHKSPDADRWHRARIAAKHLRYVIEPVSMFVSGGDTIIEELKSLQDSLGDLHDVHVFSNELASATEEAIAGPTKRSEKASQDDPGPGLRRLARRLHERETRAYPALQRAWLNGAGAALFDRVRDLSTSVRADKHGSQAMAHDTSVVAGQTGDNRCLILDMLKTGGRAASPIRRRPATPAQRNQAHRRRPQ